jgi:hypothetical protein
MVRNRETGLSFGVVPVWRCFLLTAAIVLCTSTPVGAHEGPPYPVIVDKIVGPCLVSVWTDPDVGIGTFLIFPEGLEGKLVPADLQVDVVVQPVSKRIPEASFRAIRADLTDRAQFKAEVAFDAQEYWNVRIVLHSSQGDGEATVQVEVTPPGYGRWDLVIYLLPFLAVGFLWLRAIMKKRSYARRKI